MEKIIIDLELLVMIFSIIYFVIFFAFYIQAHCKTKCNVFPILSINSGFLLIYFFSRAMADILFWVALKNDP